MNRTLILSALLGVALTAPVVYGRLEREEALPPMSNPDIPGTDAVLLDELARACGVTRADIGTLAGDDCAVCAQPQRMACLDRALIQQLQRSDPLVGMWAMEAAIARGATLDEQAVELATNSRAPEPARARALVVLAWTMPREEAIVALRARLTDDDGLALAAALELGRLRATEATDELAALEKRLERPADRALVAYSRALISGTAEANALGEGI